MTSHCQPALPHFAWKCACCATPYRSSSAAAAATFLVVRTVGFVLLASQLLFVSTVIQLALALPMAWYFHRATTMALPANALMIPIASVLLPSAVLAVVLSYLSHWLAYAPAAIAGYSLDILTGTVRLIGHLRVSEVRVPTPTLAVSLAAALAVASGAAAGEAARPGRSRSRRIARLRIGHRAVSAEAAMASRRTSRSRQSMLGREIHCS